MHQIPSLIAQETTSAPASGLTDYVSAIGVLVIGLLAAWIAFRQFQTARNKLKLDLYDKRMAVYDVVRNTLGAATSRGVLSRDEEIAYLSGIQPAKWLFGPEVSNYLEVTLWRKIAEFDLHNTMSSGSVSDERTRHIHARTETMQWLVAQFEELDKMCRPYLQLRH